jgi:hypothetical protein
MPGDDPKAPADPRTTLRDLVTVLDVAGKLLEELAGDPILQRVLEAFRLMPMEDRPVIVSAIEREVQARRLSCATDGTTGQSMHPNPNARLYMRLHESVVPRNLLERDELMLAMLSGMRVSPLLLMPDIHASWIDGTREAIEHLDAPTRATVTQLLGEVLALVEDPAVAPPYETRTSRAS